MEMERKRNGKFMNKIGDRKQNGNRLEVQRIWNGNKAHRIPKWKNMEKL